jgi:hypothetical protein
LDRKDLRQLHLRNGGNQMSEMFSETGSSTASDSVAHMAKDNAAQSSSDASPEDYYDSAGFSLEVGEVGPAGFSDEADSSGSGSGSDIWERTITPDFNKPKDGTGDKGDGVKKGGGDQLTPPDKLTPEHTPPDTFINPKTPAP